MLYIDVEHIQINTHQNYIKKIEKSNVRNLDSLLGNSDMEL